MMLGIYDPKEEIKTYYPDREVYSNNFLSIRLINNEHGFYMWTTPFEVGFLNKIKGDYLLKKLKNSFFDGCRVLSAIKKIYRNGTLL